jgi:hypothetical protein
MIEIIDRKHIRITCDVCGVISTKELAFEIPEGLEIDTEPSKNVQACQSCYESSGGKTTLKEEVATA